MSTLSLPWDASRSFTTQFERNLKRCPDFGAACRKVAAHCYALGAQQEAQSQRKGAAFCDPSFWLNCGQEAQDVADLVSTVQQQHPTDWKPPVLDVLRGARLCDYYAALEEDTGAAYAEYLGF